MDRPVMRDIVPIDRVWARLEKVERRLYEVTASEDSFLTETAQHLLGAGGKRYRPLLAQVAAELGGSDGDGSVEAGVAVEPMVTKSNGGVMRAELGKSAPIQMLLSGTASGVIGASHIAALAGENNVLSYDVGGTSADTGKRLARMLGTADARRSAQWIGETGLELPVS